MQRLNVIDLYEQHRVEYRTRGPHTSNGWVQVACPYCGPYSNDFHLGFSLKWPRYNCWKCGKLPLTKTLKLVLGVTDAVARQYTKSFPRDRTVFDEIGVLNKEVKYRAKTIALEDRHYDFLRSKNLPAEETARTWSLAAYAPVGPLKNRIHVPIEFHGRVVSWTTRSLGYSGVRWISASPAEEVIRHKSLLYGYDYCSHACIVVEGPSDVWAVGPGACATFGTDFSNEQVQLISQFPERYICYDRKATGPADRLADRLDAFPGDTYVVFLESGGDPGESSEAELQNLRKLLE